MGTRELGELGTLPNGMKISHKLFPDKGFSHQGFSHLVTRPVEAVVLFGAAFDGTRFEAVGAVEARGAGDPPQQEVVKGATAGVPSYSHRYGAGAFRRL